MKWLAIFVAVLASSAAHAEACDLYPTTRPVDVTGYVEMATSCLNVPPEPARFDADAEAKFARDINAARRAEALAPLDVRADLLPAARFHSLDQIWNGTFGHDGAAGRTQGDRISALDRTLVRSFSAENVAMVSGDFDPEIVPNLLHNGLMESPGHRRNILAEDATHMAVGVARVRDAWVVTQLFARVEGELDRPAPTRITDDGNALAMQAQLNAWSPHAVRAGPSTADAPDPCRANCPETRVSVIEVEGRRPLEVGQGYRAIYLSGPSWDVPGQVSEGADAP
ncbi:MAG: CAP domain-containing protein [Pseudomonadota bacterium]